VGTAGSANVGKTYGMFEAIHGSAPRMVKENRAQYADPSSLLRAAAMMLENIGFEDMGSKLHKAIDICGQYERKVITTGRSSGATGVEFGQYIMDTVTSSDVEQRWQEYVAATG
jgi:isocitrate dehydrogenase (NAD+)